MEKKKYCTFCGAENRLDDVLCCRCQQNLNAEDELFKDFLMNHTKDKLKGKMDDSLRDIIMNFLKSHLYGMVFTISLVAAVGVTAVAGTGIPRVTHRPDFTDTPVINDVVHADDKKDETSLPESLMSESQIEVKAVVDQYFKIARSQGTPSSMIYYEEFDIPGANFHFVPSFDVTEVGKLESSTLDYHLLTIDSELISYTSALRQRDAGYPVAQVTLVETLVANGGEMTETMFDLCLVYRDNQWLILQASDVSDDPKSLYYYDELLWDMMYETIAGLDLYFLPYEFGYHSDEDVKETISLDMDVIVSWFDDLGQRVSTVMSDELVADGYRIAQAILDDEKNNRQIVFTFVNVAGNWYVAEIVER